MKKNRLMQLIVAVILAVFFITACGSNKKTTQTIPVSKPETLTNTTEADLESEDDDSDYDDSEEDYDDEDDIDDGTIRENGQLPEDEYDFTDAERKHYSTIIINALLTLDLDVLAEYSDDTYDLEKLQRIKDNETDFALWNNVIGTTKYFADEDLLVSKSMSYIYTQWFTDAWRANADMVEAVEDITREDALVLYETYFKDAPYRAFILRHSIDLETEDGYIMIDIDDMLDSIYGFEVGDIVNHPNSNEALNLAVLMMGDSSSLGLGYDYIADDFPDYMTFMDLDLDKIIELTKEYRTNANESSDLYWNAFDQYYLDEKNVAVIKEFIAENVTAQRDLSRVLFFYPYTIYEDSDFTWNNEADKKEVESYDLVKSGVIYEYPGIWGNEFSFFYNLAKYLEQAGMFE